MDAISRSTRRPAALALAALLCAGCAAHDVQLVLELNGLVPAASDVVDVYVLRACPAHGLVGAEPTDALLHESFVYGARPAPLGALRLAHAGVYARVHGGASACVRAAGCTEVAMLGATTAVDVPLAACNGTACPGAPRNTMCADGPDASVADAGVRDASDACPDGAMPQPEICDDVDNDCDGLIDENLTMPCQIDSCNPGIQTCAAGHWTVCLAIATPACATTPIGACDITRIMGSMIASGTYTFDGTTCGAADHFALPNDPPCTPDQVYDIGIDEALGSDPAIQIASDMPVAVMGSCNVATPTMCGTTFTQRSTRSDGVMTLVLESPDGGCGPYHMTLTAH